MIYEIDLIFCAISAFFFKNYLTFALFLLLGYFIFKYFINKLNNITIIIYILFLISIFAGGVVLSCIPSKEDVLCSTMINSYYLGPVAFVLFVSLLVSIITDLIRMPHNKKIEKQKKKNNIRKIKKTIKK